jgi:hypothetical protein
MANRRRGAVTWLEIATITTVTPALWLAKFAHLKLVCKGDFVPMAKINGQKIGTCCPWQMLLVETKAAAFV